jgi:hypothetical protein
MTRVVKTIAAKLDVKMATVRDEPADDGARSPPGWECTKEWGD